MDAAATAAAAGDSTPTTFLPCTDEDRRWSVWAGSAATDPSTSLVDQALVWQAVRSTISAIAVDFDASQTCIVGMRVTYGHKQHGAEYPAALGRRVGLLAAHSIQLAAVDLVTSVDVKASDRCITWVRFTTNTNKTLSAGAASAGDKLVTMRPPQRDGFLSALRAYVNSPRRGSTFPPQLLAATTPGLVQLQMVWSSCAKRVLEVATDTAAMRSWYQQAQQMLKEAPIAYLSLFGNYSMEVVPEPHTFPTWLLPSPAPALPQVVQLATLPLDAASSAASSALGSLRSLPGLRRLLSRFLGA